jgi:hypothetical protein
VRGFKAGFTNRNPLVLIVAGVLLVPALLGFEYYFTSGAWSDVPLKYWLRKPTDSFTYVSWTVGHTKLQRPPGVGVYLTGGSSAREALVSGQDFAAAVKAAGGPAVTALDLGFINQNFAETLAIADNVPARGSWVLIGVNLGRFTSYPAVNERQVVGRDLLLKSAFLQQYVAGTYGRYTYSFTILPGIFSYLTDFAKQDGKKVLRGDLPSRTYRQHQYTVAGNHSVKRKQRMVQTWLTSRYPVFARNLDYNLAMLEQILQRCRERGVHAVLVELPLNRDIVGSRFEKAIVQYTVPTMALADEYDVPYIDVNRAADVPNGDFHDLSHLVEPGRVLWQRELAKALAPLLERAAASGAGASSADAAASGGAAHAEVAAR